jgi:alpha-tubulin suppressor-like RCC1 family protein
VSIEIALRPYLRRLAVIAALVGALAAMPATASALGGTAKGWGYNASGQVGNGAVSPPECYCVEVPTALLGVTEVTEMAAGYEHGLGLLADGRMMSWGYNSDGELGDGTTTLNAVPTPVAGVSGVVAVAAGTAHSMALLGDGSILAWGNNRLGQLGLGGAAGPETCGMSTPCSRVPLQVPGISNAIAIAASEYHSMALLADGSVLGWGEDEHGEMGNGVGTTTGCKCVPSPTAIPGVPKAAAIAAGAHTGAALLFDGTVRIWGRNAEGQLGTGATTPAVGCACLGPVSPAGLGGVRQISNGGDHTLALLAGGGAVGWGEDGDGQVGVGAKSGPPCFCVLTPTPVLSALSDPQAVDSGEAHSAALMSDGSVRTWGANGSGELGSGGGTSMSRLRNRFPGSAVRARSSPPTTTPSRSSVPRRRSASSSPATRPGRSGDAASSARPPASCATRRPGSSICVPNRAHAWPASPATAPAPVSAG